VFPVRYELNLYMLFRRNSVFKGLSRIILLFLIATEYSSLKYTFLKIFLICIINIWYLKGRDQYEYLDVDGSIIIKWMGQMCGLD
jgi:hypothetical protein